MTNYYTGIQMDAVPTGFGGYKGIVLSNKGNNVVSYDISISSTIFDPVVNDAIDSLFLSKSSKYIFDSNGGKNIKLQILPNESDLFYILHKPFITDSTGYEISTVTIKSISSCGTLDQDIIVDVTGHRETGFSSPDRVGKFYGVKNYDSTNNYNVNFNWESLQHNNYFTGFKLELSSSSSFASILNTNYLAVPKNTDNNLPLYGNYDGFLNIPFSYSEANLPLTGDLYTRIQPISPTGETGAYSFPTGFDSVPVSLNAKTIYAGISQPGYDFKFIPEILYLNYNSDNEVDFDLYDFVVKNNNNSTDFSRYSGINIVFTRQTSDVDLAVFKASSTDLGVINFTPTSMNFNTGNGGIFRMELEFENIGLYGYGGEGLTWKPDGTYTDALNGGPIFNFDNFEIRQSDESVKKIQYYIYKDNDTRFYAGAGGSQGLLITDTTESNQTVKTYVNGQQFNNLNLINLINIGN
jgi:hypothetical protein